MNINGKWGKVNKILIVVYILLRFENEADHVLAATFSSSGKFFAATDDHKSLAVWSTDESWKLIYTKY